MISYHERLNFYLGDLWNYDKINIHRHKDKHNLDTIYKTCKSQDPIVVSRYHEALSNLLIDLKYGDRYFKAVYGDISRELSKEVFCKSRVTNKGVILRSLNFLRHWRHYYDPPRDAPFDDKESRVFWRGTSTGSKAKLGNRFYLIENWFDKIQDVDVGFSKISQKKSAYQKYVKGRVDITTYLKYKYILSVEGNDKDSGLNWKLNSNSLVLMCKPRSYSWLMEDKLIPNFHYVLLKDDFSDLHERLRWCNGNVETCRDIIKNANDFMKNFENFESEERLERDVIHAYFKIIHSTGRQSIFKKFFN